MTKSSTSVINGNSMKYHGNSKYKDATEVTFNAIINRYLQKARIRKLCWLLSKEFAKNLLISNCHYCGSKPENLHNAYIAKTGKYRVNRKEWAESGWVKFNGIDRVDNSQGYIENNCVSCCTFCNYAKHDNLEENFIKWLDQVATFRKKNE